MCAMCVVCVVCVPCLSCFRRAARFIQEQQQWSDSDKGPQSIALRACSAPGQQEQYYCTSPGIGRRALPWSCCCCCCCWDSRWHLPGETVVAANVTAFSLPLSPFLSPPQFAKRQPCLDDHIPKSEHPWVTSNKEHLWTLWRGRFILSPNQNVFRTLKLKTSTILNIFRCNFKYRLGKQFVIEHCSAKLRDQERTKGHDRCKGVLTEVKRTKTLV